MAVNQPAPETRITREFRFFLRPGGLGRATDNAWAGWGSGLTMAPWLALRLQVAGPVDPVTGYLCDIRVPDRALHAAVDGWLAGRTTLEGLKWTEFLRDIRRAVPPLLPEPVRMTALQLVVSPLFRLTVSEEQSGMIEWTQQFEFSAAHRLHCRELSDDENRRLFGKCNNPSGHGHNYVVEVSVLLPEGGPADGGFSADLEQRVRREVIDRLDHRHLNEDTPEFADCNPSVENIARVIWGWLEGRLGEATLQRLRLYETPKTWVDLARAGGSHLT